MDKEQQVTRLPKLSYAQVINLVRNAYADDVAAIKRPTDGTAIWKVACKISRDVRGHGFHSNPHTFATLIVEDMLKTEGMFEAFGVHPTFIKPESDGRDIHEVLKQLYTEGRIPKAWIEEEPDEY